MRRSNATILAAAILALPATAARAGEPQPLWETSGFQAPESALYDPATDLIYVANVNGPPGDKDGNGFISTVGTDGAIRKLDWVAGLHAPKGMAVVNGKLYVADVDTLVEIGVADGTILNRYEDPTAKFMNDVAAGPDGAVYVSDSFTNRIYRLKDGKFEVWTEDPALDSPNGLFIEADRIIVGSLGVFGEKGRPGRLLSVSMKDKSVAMLKDAVGNLDAVESDGAGGYYVTDWPGGRILHHAAGGELSTVLTLTPGTADMDVVLSKGRIYLPRMMDGKLAAFPLSTPAK
jgi:DNA-binding beta-propeller fold protein YncE